MEIGYNIYNYKHNKIFVINMKEYIYNVYQNYSKFKPVPSMNLRTGCNSNKGDLIEHFYQQDKETGILYQEKPNWIGGETKPLSQAMSDYIFENVNVPISLPTEEEKPKCPNLR